MDAAYYSTDILPKIGANSFSYLDPPYYVKGGDLYEHFYKHDDHEKISNIVRNMDGHWIISYDADPKILNFYKDFRKLVYGLSYSAAGRHKGAEVMFFSPKIRCPIVVSPPGVKRKDVEKEKISYMSPRI